MIKNAENNLKLKENISSEPVSLTDFISLSRNHILSLKRGLFQNYKSFTTVRNKG